MDGMSLVFRSFYGWRNRAGDPLVNAAGDDVSVLYSVAHAILAMLELAPTHLAVCFDAKGKTFRHEMFADYKANRPPTPPEIAEVIPRCVKMVEDMGVPCLSESGVEADDVIGTIARRAVEAGLHVSIVSPDKDFFQLLGPRVRQLRPNGKNYVDARGGGRAGARDDNGNGDGDGNGGGDTDGGASDARGDNAQTKKHTEYGFGDPTHRNVTGRGLVPYTEADFRAEYSDLDPAQFVDLLAMVGDSSDNVPGVEGIGPKTAPRLLVEYGDIEGAVANAADIKNTRAREGLGSARGAATALLCRSLVKIRTELNVPTLNPPALELRDIQLSNGRVPPPDGGAWVGEHLERTLELPNAGERWREICYRAKLEAEERKKNRVA
jgi:5'-3' exonuclease